MFCCTMTQQELSHKSVIDQTDWCAFWSEFTTKIQIVTNGSWCLFNMMCLQQERVILWRPVHVYLQTNLCHTCPFAWYFFMRVCWMKWLLMACKGTNKMFRLWFCTVVRWSFDIKEAATFCQWQHTRDERTCTHLSVAWYLCCLVWKKDGNS